MGVLSAPLPPRPLPDRTPTTPSCKACSTVSHCPTKVMRLSLQMVANVNFSCHGATRATNRSKKWQIHKTRQSQPQPQPPATRQATCCTQTGAQASRSAVCHWVTSYVLCVMCYALCVTCCVTSFAVRREYRIMRRILFEILCRYML